MTEAVPPWGMPLMEHKGFPAYDAEEISQKGGKEYRSMMNVERSDHNESPGSRTATPEG